MRIYDYNIHTKKSAGSLRIPAIKPERRKLAHIAMESRLNTLLRK